MVASDSFADFLSEQLAPLGRITMRRMFGSTGVFCAGAMLGLVHDDTLYLRVDAGNRELFAEAADAPFTYVKQGQVVALSYWQVPERLLDDADEFTVWARAALEAAERVAARRKPRRSRRAALPDDVELVPEHEEE